MTKIKVSSLQPGPQMDALVEDMQSALSYCRETGEFTWIRPRSNSVKQGDIAGNINAKGYVVIAFKSKSYMAHRIAWLFVNGEWPKGQIDHINHIRHDNRIENLRVVTHSDNCRNRTLTKRNSSGVVGVRWRVDISKWVAEIYINRKVVIGGYFKEKEDAIKSRKSLEEMYGFHENHGSKQLYSKIQ